MELEEKVQAVEALMDDLDAEILKFQGWSGLGCKAGCGKCCLKPDIEATVLEFLPFALHLYRTNQAEIWLERLSNEPSSLCMILDPLGLAGMCSSYRYRGLACRLFGFSARINKHNRKEIVTCQLIKTDQAGVFQNAQTRLEENMSVPVTSHFYMQLHAIDFNMAREFFPINQAIKRAIEVILHYYAYRA